MGRFVLHQSQIIKDLVKYKNTLIIVVTNPFLISAVIAVSIIITLPPVFNKYKVEITRLNKIQSNLIYYYADINNNGISEKIEFRQMRDNFFSLTVYENNKVVDQWNFDGKFFVTTKPIVTEVGKDSIKSIYFFLFKNNKIYLNCLSPFENNFVTKDKFVIDYIPKIEDKGDIFYSRFFYDSNKDGTKEFYFTTNVGYSIQPRRVCKYDPVKDSVFLSPESYACLNSSIIDTSGNVLKLIFASDAVGNSELNDPYSDMYAWLMFFDENLSFKYEPVKIGFYSSLSSIVSVSINGESYFVCLNIYDGIKNHPSSLRLFDSNLKLIKEREFNYLPEWRSSVLYSNNHQPDHFYLLRTNGKIEKLNYNLDVVSETNIPAINTTYLVEDIDGDNQNEIILMDKDRENLIIASNDFSGYTSANISGFGSIRNYSVKLNGNEPRELVLSSSNEEIFLRYETNSFYYLQYPIYAGIYAVVLLLILLIQKAQKHRAELKYETEKRIAELQLKAIKNQVDPHFTLNILNSIGSLFYKQDREKADYIFGKYSKLLRMTVLNSDKIITTLSDELDYVENYIELEKFRNDNKFCWEIVLDKNVNTNIKIPKMLIHTFVENSIKHGLRHLDGKGKLLINVESNPGYYNITISDNGIGRKEAKKNESQSTGRGLNILKQMLDLYYNLMKVRISYEIKDLVDENEKALGMEVAIIIPVIYVNEH